MKLSSYLVAATVALAVLSSCSRKIDCTVPAVMKDGVITLEVPARQPGQISAIKMACAPIENVRVGFIGLGMRGSGAVNRFMYVEGASITALCDLEQERVSAQQDKLAAHGLAGAAEYVGDEAWKQLCESEDVDLVYICTDWVKHTPMAVYAMQHGKHVAIEVPAAMSVDECWQLVNTCEQTRRHCMMLENCVYDFFEMATLGMIQHGLLGEVLYGEGAYIHNLDPYWDEYYGNWRLEYNRTHRGDNYPTHGLGPLCQAFNIHRGDVMTRLVAVDTKSVHGKAVAKEKMGVDEFADGDQTTTLIRTARGKVIEIQHNVYGCRPYSRIHSITGSEGYVTKYPKRNAAVESVAGERFVSAEQLDSLLEANTPDFVKEIRSRAKEVGGHGGMDFIMDSRLVYCLNHGLPLDEDVYDAAEWSCLTELSRLSIENGNVQVEVPDFTRGEWDKVNGFYYEFAE